MEKRIYLDYAATTPLSKEVLADMMPYLTESYGNTGSPHFYGRKALSAVDTARDTIASLLQVSSDEIYFTSSGTESDNWALFGVMRPLQKAGKNHLIVASFEHSAVLETAKALEKEGFEVSFVKPNRDGVILPCSIEKEIRENTGLIAVMYANNETGVIQKVKEISSLAKAHGCLYFCDGVQAACYLPLLPKEEGMDILSLSAHKFYGPKGVGVLYVRHGIKMDSLIFGGTQEHAKRGGTVNVANIVGCASAYVRAVEEREENNAKISLSRRAFEKVLFENLTGIFINGNGEKVPSILNLTISGVANDTFLRKMDLEGIAISTGAACTSGIALPSETLLSMGLTLEEVNSSVRISFGKDVSEEDAKKAGEVAVKVIKQLRGE